MKKNLLWPIMAAALALTSCSKQFYQVYTTEAPELVEKEDGLIYENKDCIIKYNLWAEDGALRYSVYNKTEQDLFIILPQSFFIKNGTAYNYFENKEYIRMVSSSISLNESASISATQNQRSSRGTSYTLVEKENETVCIPPHSQKHFSKFNLWSKLIKICNSKDTYPKKTSAPVKFTKTDSPLVFSNRMAYTFNKKGDDLIYIENNFWVSQFINYSKKEACENKEYRDCRNEVPTKEEVFKIYSPRKFYNSYIGSKNSKKVYLFE